jgi:formylglycine-generating enzyme required for sulfatase activity
VSPVAAMTFLAILTQIAAGQDPLKSALELNRLDTLIELAEARRDCSRIAGSLAKLDEGKFDAASDKTLERLRLQLNAAEGTLRDLRAQEPSDETKKRIALTEARVAALSEKVKLAQTSLREYFKKELVDSRGDEKRLMAKLKEIQSELDRPPTPVPPQAQPSTVAQPPAPAPPTAPAKVPEPPATLVNPKDSLQYAWIPPGSFKMGCVPNDHHCEKDEYPPHEVTIKSGFWITNSEVTVNAYVFQFKREPPKTETNPKWKYTDLPVTKVKWQDAEDYCEWVGGRLPTEAEWEYAARGGARDDRIYPWGSEFDPDRCNSTKYHKRRKVFPEATPVRIFNANGWNLFDMIGNVREWTWNVYTPDGYSGEESSTDPRASAPGKDRVVRGGSFGDGEKQLRTSARGHLAPEKFDNQTGFRCVITGNQIAAK